MTQNAEGRICGCSALIKNKKAQYKRSWPLCRLQNRPYAATWQAGSKPSTTV